MDYQLAHGVREFLVKAVGADTNVYYRLELL